MRFRLLAIQMLLLAAFAHAEDSLAALVAQGSLETLRAGKTVSASLPADGTVSLLPSVDSRDSLLAEVKVLHPTLGAELLQVLPGPGIVLESPEGMLLLYNILHSVSSLSGTTYWSVTHGKDRVLFTQSYAIAGPSRTDRIDDPVFSAIPADDELFTFQEDSSFGKNTYEEHFTARPDHLLVKTENLSTVSLFFIPIVQPRNFVSHVILVPSGTDVLFYGLACIRTGMPLGDRTSRVESLQNRLKAMAGWLGKRLAASATP